MQLIGQIVFVLLLIFPIPTFAENPVSKATLQYEGAFRVPKGSLGGASSPNALTLRSGETMQPIAFNPKRNSLIISGFPIDKLVAEISIPVALKTANITDLNTATTLQVPVDPTNGHWDNVAHDGTVVSGATGVEGGYPGGLMVYNNKIIGTSWLYYDASGTNGWRSHFTASIDWATTGTQFSGLYEIGTRLVNPTLANGGFVGGYMTKIPSAWQSALGGPALTGIAKIPIVSRGSLGPSIWSFDPEALGTANPTPATALVAYPIEHSTLGSYDSDAPNLYYNKSGGYGGIVFPEGSDSVMIVGHHGLGIELNSSGVPVASEGSCSGAGTSDRSEAKTNGWLLANSPNGWLCGITTLSASDIAGGASCCLDPANTASTGNHTLSYKVGTGQSCYGWGTPNINQVRNASWLQANSPGGWQCDGKTINSDEIAVGDACCYDESDTRGNKGGKSFPYVYQIWRYNANDLAKVKAGTTNSATGQPYKPWDIMPDIINFDLPFAPTNKAILGATYDAETQRMYVAQLGGDTDYPLIHVFNIGLTPITSGASLHKTGNATIHRGGGATLMRVQ